MKNGGQRPPTGVGKQGSGRKGEWRSDIVDALMKDNARVEWFHWLVESDTDEEETCDAKMPSNDDDISTIDIGDELDDNEDKGPLRFLKDAWQEACDDREGERLCTCQRVVGDKVETPHFKNCGTCGKFREEKIKSKEVVRAIMKELEKDLVDAGLLEERDGNRE